MEKIKVGINGFGRIGRLIFRAGFEHLDIVGINSLDDPKGMAHLLKYDSTHGRYSKDVCVEDSVLRVDGKSIPLSATKNPLEIPWKKWGVDLVLECTGGFKSKDDFLKHINAGARRVLVSAPADGVDLTAVYGINHTQYDSAKHQVVSNASCTTNCLAPLAKVLDEAFTIEQGLMTTIHSYTNDQNVLDATHKDLRRSRAAGLSMIPTTTGAAKAVGLVLPHLKGKVDGVSIRVPTPNVSLVDLVFRAQKPLSVESINRALQEAAQGSLKGILFCEKDPLVSVDYNGSAYSSIVDLANTMVMGEKLAKVFSWYDNEMGFSSRMVDMALYMAKKG